MTKRVKKLIYHRHLNGYGLHDITVWLDETGYKKKTVKEKPAKIIEIKSHLEVPFPM
jgi:hypothetical protein